MRTPTAGLKACATTLLLGAATLGLAAHTQITTPRQQFDFDIGADYQLANYAQLAEYWRKLDAQSDRMVLQEIGTTSEGRPHLMAIVTSPENHRNLQKYRDISRRLAFAEGLTDAEARALAKDGKAVVWIDGGLHANEMLGAQQLIQIVYEMVSRTDEETARFLNDCIILFVHANPDGHDLVADWYMRHPDPERRSSAGLPRLYHQYIGHDNNRDFFASTQKETENINRVLYHDWMPQILYNHHQSGPAGTVAWSSPQRDPYNYNLDPLLILGLQALGTHMHQRLAAEGKPGMTMASGGPYDGWWNGGIRNTGNFHNIIAILTETIGSPTPMRIPFRPERQLPNRDHPFPIAPQEWTFSQAIDYSMSFNRAVIDYASRNREHLLCNIYRMGQRAIQRGSEDTWTPSPSRLAEITADDPNAWAALRTPERRDPRGYIIPADQADFPTAVKFINALREVNVTVQRATRAFEVRGTSYPAGSFVVMTAQAFRPHVIDMFEPQDHPNVIPYPGAPPTPPYDNAGWTLAFQMGIEFPFWRVFAQELDAGGLHAKLDTLIFVNGAIPPVPGEARRGGRRSGGRGQPPDLLEIPAEYRSHVGRMTAERTLPQLRAFVEAGGTIVAIGSSAENIVAHFGLPLEDHLVENGKPLPRAKYFVPGSVLAAKVDTTHPVAAGMKERTNFFFDNSPVFRLKEGASATVRTIAVFDTETPLKSGWAWGQQYLKGGIAAAEVRVGKGRVLLYGPEILHRAQPHGTFKLLFNALLR